MKVHHHEEQFDGAMHAACYRLSVEAGDPRVVGTEDFAKTPRAQRCKLCDRNWWPFGAHLGSQGD